MPTIGSFHDKFWVRRISGPPPPAGESSDWSYPRWQTSVIAGSFALFEAVRPAWEQAKWLWRLAISLWWVRSPEARADVETWIAQRKQGPVEPTVIKVDRPVLQPPERIVQVEVRPDPAAIEQAGRWKRAAQEALRELKTEQDAPSRQWAIRYESADAESRAIFDRVLAAVTSPAWPAAREAVRSCATTPKFHQSQQWVEYGRAVKADPVQAQNIFRHLKVVTELQQAHGLSNPEAHLLAELAYQGMASEGRPRRIIEHPKRLIEHEKQVIH